MCPSINYMPRFVPRCYGGHCARRSWRKVWRLGMRLTHVLVLRAQKASFCKDSTLTTNWSRMQLDFWLCT